MSLVNARMPAISQLRQLLLADPELFRACSAMLAAIMDHATFSVFEVKFAQSFSPELMSHIQLHGFELIASRLASNYYASAGDLVQEAYAFFDSLDAFYMPGSLRILVENARDHFDKVLQKSFPFIRSALQNADNGSEATTLPKPRKHDREASNQQTTEGVAVATSSRPPSPSRRHEHSGKRRRREEPQPVVDKNADLARWAALCEVVWCENIDLMLQRTTKRIEMASEPFSGNQPMFDALRHMHRAAHRLESLKRRRRFSVPFSTRASTNSSFPDDNLSNQQSGDHPLAVIELPADGEASPLPSESAGASETAEHREEITAEIDPPEDEVAMELSKHKAVHRFQLFFQLTVEVISQYESVRKVLARRFSSSSLAALDEKIQVRKAKIENLRSLRRSLTTHAVDEIVLDFIQLVQLLVLNQILQLEGVSEDARTLFQDLQQLYKRCRTELLDLDIGQHRAFATSFRTAAETLVLVFIDNRCSQLLPDMEQRKILAHTLKVLSRCLNALMSDDDKRNEWVVCEQLTFADIGLGYLEFTTA